MAAWRLTREDRVGMATLGDFAAGGVLVHRRATQPFGQLAEPEVRGDAGRRVWLEQAANAWRLVHLHISQLALQQPSGRPSTC